MLRDVFSRLLEEWGRVVSMSLRAEVAPRGAESTWKLDVLTSTITAGLMAVFTYLVLNPKVGFDDANITQSYAENIARGLGYVYYAGGERVEGSTSALWTLFNTGAFLLFERPEPFLGATGIVIMILTILVSINIARWLAQLAALDAALAPPIVAGLYLLVPTFTGWTAWSLMDAGLWMLLVAAFVGSGLRLLADDEQGRGAVSLFVILAVLVTWCRPEGVAVGLGLSLLLLLLQRLAPARHLWNAGLYGAAVSLAAFAALAALRLWYFGYPHPNTYYAKVSTKLGPQVIDGLKYLKSYLTEPVHILLFILAALGLLALSKQNRTFLAAVLFIGLFILGGILVYVGLGGDHFGSHRFYQVFLPVLIPSASLSLLMLLNANRLRKAATAATLVIGLAAITYQWLDFTHSKGDYAVEFGIAEMGRDMGERLNALPDRPSVGIYIAGGIAMTYEGPIYDLLGLNWVAMAHAERDHAGRYTNHGGFARSVFFETLPVIVSPERRACDDRGWITHSFTENILDGLFADPEFNEIYVEDCWNGLSFFRKRTYTLPPE